MLTLSWLFVDFFVRGRAPSLPKDRGDSCGKLASLVSHRYSRFAVVICRYLSLTVGIITSFSFSSLSFGVEAMTKRRNDCLG